MQKVNLLGYTIFCFGAFLGMSKGKGLSRKCEFNEARRLAQQLYGSAHKHGAFVTAHKHGRSISNQCDRLQLQTRHEKNNTLVSAIYAYSLHTPYQALQTTSAESDNNRCNYDPLPGLAARSYRESLVVFHLSA